jgi:2'-5' RNA ligase
LFAIHLFFDATTEAAIRTVWSRLAETGTAPYMHLSGNRPHLSVAIYEHLDVAASGEKLSSLPHIRAPLSLTFSCLGLFPTEKAVVFLAPTVTVALLDLQKQLHQLLAEDATAPLAYYLPNQWTPHCTLALDIPHMLIPQLLHMGMELPLSLSGHIAEIGIIEFRPVKHLFSLPFSGTGGTDLS